MYYVVKVKEYRCFKADIQLIEITESVEKAKALRDALQAIHTEEHYEVLTVV